MACCSLFCSAQQSHEKYTRALSYLLYLPNGYGQDTSKQWPLLIFLHGSGECGDDLEKVKVNGPPRLIEEGKKIPFIVVSPQADAEFGWETEELFHFVLSLKQKYRVDDQRIYLTGLSMGGFGTWALAAKHPELFAAIAPVSGGGDTSESWKLRHMSVWCFHGALDPVVPIVKDQAMIDALRRYNPSTQFTVYTGVGHDAWTATYNNDSLYAWFLSNRKFSYKQVPILPSRLVKYSGTYVHDVDTVTVVAGSGTITLASGHGKSWDLKPASDSLFFLDPKAIFDIEFMPGPSGKIDRLIFSGNEKIVFTKTK
jgi:predicted peptidase